MCFFNNLFLLLIIVVINSPVFGQEKDTISVKPLALQEVIVLGRNPISERFSVTKIEKLDIYFNPTARGDALNAIQILPASTNTDETANPVLRGGDADRSRVYLNGAPILNPVRNSQSNGLGNFSLLNTEIIEKQYVYASNPPLTYGNSSAGIVEIETNQQLNNNGLQLSLALSNIGLMFNKKLSDKIFLQAYGNRQFSDILLKLNRSQLPDLDNFSSTDVGLNSRINFNKKWSFNSISYFINEEYNAKNYYLNYKNNSEALQERFFTINNIDYLTGRSKFRLSSLYDRSNKRFKFGLTDSDLTQNLYFMSLSHKYAVTNMLTFQYGLDFMHQDHHYDELRPLYYYANNKKSPTYFSVKESPFTYGEVYAYSDYKINSRIGISTGIRQNIYTSNSMKNFTSFQLSSFFHINRTNRLVFGIGNYNSYSTPNYIQQQVYLLNSKQVALDYSFEKRKYNVVLACFFKNDQGNFHSNTIERFDKILNTGFEMGGNYNLSKNLSMGISNSFLIQHGYLDKQRMNTTNNLKYFIKSHIIYNNPKLLTTSISVNTRPGSRYTKVVDATFNPLARDFEPSYELLNNSIYHKYTRIDFTANKIFNIKNNALIGFLTINNVLNKQNQSTAYYKEDYTLTHFRFFQQRVIYLGIQFRINN